MHHFVTAALGAAGICYYLDVVHRPVQIAKLARLRARQRKKPLLNVGAGTPGSSLRVAIFGPTQWGDVNCDYAVPPGTQRRGVCHCDVHRLPWPDRTFGAVIASHTLEHVADPMAATAELARVADEVYVLTPRWWSPVTWLYWDHRWYRDAAGRWHPLWQFGRKR